MGCRIGIAGTSEELHITKGFVTAGKSSTVKNSAAAAFSATAARSL
jgi:hypothetical protein